MNKKDERELFELGDALCRAMTTLPYMPQHARTFEILAEMRARRIARDERISWYRNAKP